MACTLVLTYGMADPNAGKQEAQEGEAQEAQQA